MAALDNSNSVSIPVTVNGVYFDFRINRRTGQVTHNGMPQDLSKRTVRFNRLTESTITIAKAKIDEAETRKCGHSFDP